MKKFFWLVTSLLVFLLGFNCVGLAAPKPTFTKDYDFSKIKTLLILEPNFNSEEIDKDLQKQLGEVFWQHVKLKKVKVLEYDDIRLAVQMDTGIDFAQLAKEQPAEADKLFLEYAPKYVDAILYSNILEYSEGSRYVEATTRTETYYEKRGSYDSKGNWKVRDYPVRRTYTVPAHNQLTLTTRMNIVLIDAKSKQEVLWYSDYRYKEPGVFATKTPISMYERILEHFWSQLQKRF